jgi:Na+/proline symporter
MASHGTDQLIVQRLLTTKTLRDSQKAIITSGVLIMLQFTLFMIVGLFLYKFFGGVPVGDPSAPFQKPDEIFPYLIIHHLQVGIKGLIVAGLFAAAMSTLAGSMSSLSSSAMFDIFKTLRKKPLDEKRELFISRIFTVTAALVLVLVAFIFITLSQSVVEVALGIASITYGGLLGTFLLGLLSKKVGEKGAITGFTSGIIVMLSVSALPIIMGAVPLIHWTWYVALGTVVTVGVGSFFRK